MNEAKKAVDMDREELLDLVARLRDRAQARTAAHVAVEEALKRKLLDLTTAKRLANKRADEAEAKLRAITEALGLIKETAQ